MNIQDTITYLTYEIELEKKWKLGGVEINLEEAEWFLAALKDKLCPRCQIPFVESQEWYTTAIPFTDLKCKCGLKTTRFIRPEEF